MDALSFTFLLPLTLSLAQLCNTPCFAEAYYILTRTYSFVYMWLPSLVVLTVLLLFVLLATSQFYQGTILCRFAQVLSAFAPF